MITGNRGEWSEIYVFLKLMAEGNLYAADANLNRINDIYYPIMNILRKESNGTFRYKRNSVIKLIEDNTSKVLGELPISKFKEASISLFEKIKSENGAFACEEIETLLKEIEIDSIKSNSQYKEDITIVVHDFQTGLTPELSFSIKSMLGSPSTLLNASQSTNFTYKLTSAKLIVKEDTTPYGNEDVNIKKRLRQKIEEGYTLVFENIDNSNFEANLRMTDSLLPQILSEVLIEYYSGNSSYFRDIVAKLEERDPLKFKEHSKRFYTHKIKNFLLDVALGMTPASEWSGTYDATGGYIIVKEDGDIVCYHIYNINEFKEYLLQNTKLETPSTSRHKFGEFYLERADMKIKLNLQIRFIK